MLKGEKLSDVTEAQTCVPTKGKAPPILPVGSLRKRPDAPSSERPPPTSEPTDKGDLYG